MSKNTPEERWEKHVEERCQAFVVSGELKKLRAEGLKILKRKRLYTPEEWNATFHERACSQEFRGWYDRCRTIGDRFGLDRLTIELACLYKGHRLRAMPFMKESQWPKIRIVTENTDPVFLKRLAYETQRIGLGLIQRHGSVEYTYVFANPIPINFLKTPPRPKKMPPLHEAFYVRVETPILFPPEGATKLHREATQSARNILKRLGYSVPQRLRPSSLISKADSLKVEKATLPSGGAYDIMDRIYGERPIDEQQIRLQIINERYKLKKRLIDPYKLK